MNTITIWNKGRRTWPMKNAEGVEVKLEPQESVQVEEVYGLRMVAAYPKDLTTSGVAAPSLDDIKRREQSLRDREANLDKREKELETRNTLEDDFFTIPENVEIKGKGAPNEIEFTFFCDKKSFIFKGSREKMQSFHDILGEFLEGKPSSDEEPAKKRGRPAKAE